MAKEELLGEVKKLISRGKEKGYLTYEELNSTLPADMVSSEQLSNLMTIFGEMDIEIIDASEGDRAQKMSDGGEAAEEAQESEELEETENEIDLTPGVLSRTDDPVRLYLKEMGSVALLSREGEIEIAKRIEEGIREVMGAIAHFPGTVDSILAEYTRVTTEGGRLVEVLNGYIDPDDGSLPAEAAAPVPAKDGAAAEASDDEEDEEDSGDDEEEGDESAGALRAAASAQHLPEDGDHSGALPDACAAEDWRAREGDGGDELAARGGAVQAGVRQIHRREGVQLPHAGGIFGIADRSRRCLRRGTDRGEAQRRADLREGAAERVRQ